ncbi:hypothetical protein [uncultured Chitinophaga sp.]|uniref:hypothetical protein n=1 Tax=uncultured Chitinophaga sp. TaxID=339340 RepID=UPI0025E47FAB|nr:hypothetical protein [uncultured Chitinophaga sp.]
MIRYCLLLVSVCVFNVVKSQDTHYWNSQYGAGGFFVPGAVIAANGDSGVYFYNPALLGGSKIAAISMNTVLYQHQAIRIKNGAGKGFDLKSASNASVPNMLAGGQAIPGTRVSVAYALIHTPGIRLETSQRRDDQFQVLNDSYSPGNEYYVGQYQLENRAGETRAQIAWGLKLGKYWSAGLLLEGNVYSQRYSQNYSARAIVNPGVVDFKLASTDAIYTVDYHHIGLKIRPGLAYDNGRHHLGLTAGMPMIHVGGSAILVSDNLIQELVLTTPDEPFSLLANTRQEKLKVKWRTPLSIAAGYIYDLPKGKLYIAAEHYGRIKEYNIITPRNEYFIRPDTAGLNTFTSGILRLKDVRKSVTNVALGVSFNVRKDLTGYISGRTDFSFFDESLYRDDSGVVPYTATWNNFHFQLGANKRTRRANIKAGLVLTYGQKNNFRQDINFSNPSESNQLLGDVQNVAQARHITAGFLLCYVHNL